jgi:Ion channel.
MALATKNFIKVFKKKNSEYDIQKTSPRDTEQEDPAGAHILDAIIGDKEVSLEDGRVTKAYFDRLRMVELGTFIMSLIGIGLSVLQYEIEFEQMNRKWSLFLLWIIFISSILLVAMTFIRYLLRLEFRKRRNAIPETSTIWSTGEWPYMLAECILVFVHPSPFLYDVSFEMNTLYDNVRIFYYVNDLLGMILFLRVFVIFRVALMNTYWYSNRAQRLCEMYDCDPGYFFAIKCIMREYPIRIVFLGLFLSLPIFGYWIRVSERPIIRTITDPHEWNFDSYFSSMWNVIISIATVGYGDYYVKTLFGRIIVFFCCMWGSCVVSLMVVSVTTVLEMSFLENKAYHVLKRLRAKKIMKAEAAHVLTRLVKLKLRAKKGQDVPPGKIEEVKKHLKGFRIASRVYRELGNSETGFEEMERQFDFMRDQIQEVIRNTKYLMETNKLLMSVLGIDKNVFDKFNTPFRSLINNGKESIVKDATRSDFVSFMKVDEYDHKESPDKNLPYS